jgi:hypothetical protein
MLVFPSISLMVPLGMVSELCIFNNPVTKYVVLTVVLPHFDSHEISEI